MKPLSVVMALVASLSSTSIGCGDKSTNVKTDTQTVREGNNAGAPTAQRVNDRDLAALVEGNNQFAFDLYHQLAPKPGNKFFSPYSISTALAMTYAGARGNTAKEMAQTLHLTLDNERLHPVFGELIRQIQGTDKKRDYELAVANSLWGNKTGVSLDPKFLRITQTDYQGHFQLVDFTNDGEGARRTINAWVEYKTRKRIANLIPKGLITRQTRLILTNAIYFKGEWSIPFPKVATKPEDFIIPGRAAGKVPMMNCTFVTSYTDNADFQMAEFTYKNKEISMLVILPRTEDGLRDVEKGLSAKALVRALAQMQGEKLHVSLPKLKIIEEFDLSPELNKLGIKDAFVPKVADFFGMEHDGNSMGSLFISEVVHKAFLDLDEEGTEATAATGLVMSRPDSAIQPDPVAFRADHPFLFLIRHNRTGSILLIGRISDPENN